MQIDEKFQNKGIGKALIHAAVNTYLPILANKHRFGITHVAIVTTAPEIREKVEKHYANLGYTKESIFNYRYLTRKYPIMDPKKKGFRKLFRRKNEVHASMNKSKW